MNLLISGFTFLPNIRRVSEMSSLQEQMMQMLHLGDSEDDEMEFSDVPLATAATSAAAAAPPSHSAGTRPRGHVSSEAVAAADTTAAEDEDEAEEEGEESKPRTHHVSRLHCQSILPK